MSMFKTILRLLISSLLMVVPMVSPVVAQDDFRNALSLPESPKWKLTPDDITSNVKTENRRFEIFLRRSAENSRFMDLQPTNSQLGSFLSLNAGDELTDIDGDFFLLTPVFEKQNGKYTASAEIVNSKNETVSFINVESASRLEDLAKKFWAAIDQPPKVEPSYFYSGIRRGENALALSPFFLINSQSDVTLAGPHVPKRTHRTHGVPREHNRISQPHVDSFPNTSITWSEKARDISLVSSHDGWRLSTEVQELPMEGEGLPEGIKVRDVKFIRTRDFTGFFDENKMKAALGLLQKGESTIGTIAANTQVFNKPPTSAVDKEFLMGSLHTRATVVYIVEQGERAAFTQDLYFATFDTRPFNWVSIGYIPTQKFANAVGPGWAENLIVRLDPQARYWAAASRQGERLMVYHNDGVRFSDFKGNWLTREADAPNFDRALSGARDLSGLKQLVKHSEPQILAFGAPPEPGIQYKFLPEPQNVTTLHREGWRIVDFEFSSNGRALAIIWKNMKTQISEVQLWDFRSDVGEVSATAKFDKHRAFQVITVANSHDYLKVSFSGDPDNFIGGDGTAGHNEFLIVHNSKGGYEIHRFGVGFLPAKGRTDRTLISEPYLDKSAPSGSASHTPVYINFRNNELLEGRPKVIKYQLYPQVEREGQSPS